MNYCTKSVCHCCISVIIRSLNHFELDAFLLSALHALLQCWTKTDRHYNHLDPVVQSIVSLTISLRHKFVKQISAKVTNTL